MGVELTIDKDGVMVGVKKSKFGEKRRFSKLEVGNKKGKEAEGRERRGGGGDATAGGGGGGPETRVSPWT